VVELGDDAAEQLVSEHVAGWAELWESGIDVESDPELAAAGEQTTHSTLGGA
jgi:hypothetical protein